ncbi:transcriptional regulator NosR [Photobacterium sp. TY1-4]|uniref:transcriptional regulator NosR n=1 Tax=Photobacterium sp. TY1-4 TaxID=2899122 RepID=UPI0021BF2084|nr:NosR/NirI family protein [Photobacterium sp. TY1-4]UXI03494.1 NosR/NirI family protein [Photobacterium sp. TY1-4]
MVSRFNRVSATAIQLILAAFLWIGGISPASALFVSPPKDPLPLIKATFPQATRITDKAGEPLIREIYQAQALLGYAFETNDITPIPAYSGEPVNMLVVIDPQGQYLNAQVLEHHEPIILAGIPEHKLTTFAEQYLGLSVSDRIKVGGNTEPGYVAIDGLSGATVTVKVMNAALTKAATKAAQSLGIIATEQGIIQPPSTVIQDQFAPATWQQLTGDGSIRKLFLTRETVDQAFIGTEAEQVDTALTGEEQTMFAELYYALADVPTIGRNLFGEADYQWLMSTLKPDEHLVVVLGNGYSFKGSGYVRGGIFDRIQIHQHEGEIDFRDLDHHRITDLYIPGAPAFQEMSVFRIQAHHDFDPGADWQLELLVRRQTGPIDSIFSSFRANYDIPDRYVDTPPAIVPEPELSLTEQVWQERQLEVIILATLLLTLLLILFFQDLLVRHPKFMHNLRHVFLVITVVFIGWSWGGQLSIVNVFTFLHALMSEFSWDLFLLDPIIFTLWSAAAVILLLWGRAVYCGWLCPFGALQELINVAARYVKIPQYELPFAIHERLWAIKYLILLGLFGLSLDSLALAEQFAEVEPFKTTFLLKFDREWPFIAWAGFLLVLNLFQRKTFCRYLCPLGAALSVSSGARLFSWLKRRPECGQPCKTCAKECEIQAIHPDGTINMRECHYCLDCQITYYNETKCPPLKKLARKKRRDTSQDIPISVTE